MMDIECQKMTTERKNHAKDFIRDMPFNDISLLDGVICVSGDGIPHEVVNGFFSRADCDKLKLNIGEVELIERLLARG